MGLEWYHIAGGLGALALAGGGAVVAKKKIAAGRALSQEQKIALLVPSAQTAWRLLVVRCRARGFELFVGNTARTPAEQAANLEKGVSATSHSWHLLNRAVDCYPIVDGKPDLDGRRIDLFRILHEEAAKVGWRGLAFNPDGSKGAVWDGGHLEFPEGMTWAQASHRKGGSVA